MDPDWYPIIDTERPTLISLGVIVTALATGVVLLLYRGPRELDIFGLVLSMLGVAFIFFWGPPQPQLEGGVSLVVESGTPIDDEGTTAADHDAQVEQQKRRHSRFSMTGLGLVFLGFLSQFLARLMG